MTSYVCKVVLLRVFRVFRGSAFIKQTTNHTNPHEKEHETRKVLNSAMTSLLRGSKVPGASDRKTANPPEQSRIGKMYTSFAPWLSIAGEDLARAREEEMHGTNRKSALSILSDKVDFPPDLISLFGINYVPGFELKRQH